MKSDAYNWIVVRKGIGTNRDGIKLDYSEFVKDGSILQHFAVQGGYPYQVWEIFDRKGKLICVKDWGRNEGAVVWPDRVRVNFGKTGYVEVGYQRMVDGTFYGVVVENFLKASKRQFARYKATGLYKKIEALKRCPKWASLCPAIHLPDETKAAYKSAIDEAASGKYRDFEFLRDEI